MATNDRFLHNRLESTALPYVTNVSVTEARPHWVSGSHDAMASIRGWMERRPGFSTYTADNFSAPFMRFFTWQKWDGAFYVMASMGDGAGNILVKKLKVGTDTTFQAVSTLGSTTVHPDFVEANNAVYFGNGSTMQKYDGTTLYGWGADGPGTSVPTATNASSGNVPATIGHRYIYAYGNSTTGYVSDVSNPSLEITVPSRAWTIEGARSTDSYIDKVHIYRTEDGGSVYLELPNSPIANPVSGTWSISDNYTDEELLQSSPAPFPGVNDNPVGLQGFRYFAGRIWGFRGDSVYFSTFEECTTSVPEECFGQPLTNSFAFGGQVLGLGLTTDFLIVFTTRGVFRIGGDSLNTFTRSTLSRNMGVRNHLAIAEWDGKCAWLDISNTIQSTDGYTIAKDDISLPIRPDIESITHSTASMAFFGTGKQRWLVLCDGTAGKLRVFDLNLLMWFPPWAISTISVVAAGQTAAGTTQLFLGKGNKPLVVNLANWQDDGSSFTAELYTGLYTINKRNPTSVGVLQYVGTERNNVGISDVKYLTDEDPASGTYTSIVANIVDPANRTNGTALVEKWYWSNTPAAQRVSAYLSWAAANTKFILYTLDMIYREVN